MTADAQDDDRMTGLKWERAKDERVAVSGAEQHWVCPPLGGPETAAKSSGLGQERQKEQCFVEGRGNHGYADLRLLRTVSQDDKPKVTVSEAALAAAFTVRCD